MDTGPQVASHQAAEAYPQEVLFPTGPRRRWWPQLAAVAAAAVGLFWLRPPRDFAPLPEFELEPRGAAQQRSQATEAVFVPGSTFSVVLRPVGEIVDGPLDADLYVVREQEWRAWPVEDPVRSSSGALRFEQRMEGDLVLEPGDRTLVAAVGWRRALPSLSEVRRHFESGESVAPERGWRLVHKPVRVEGLPLEVEYWGCEAVLGPASEPTCALDPERTLDLWVKSHVGAKLEIVTGDRRWDLSSGEAVDTGFRFHVENLDAGELVVRTFRSGKEAAWRLALDSRRFDVVAQADELIRTGRSDEARRFLTEQIEGGVPPLEAGLLQSRLAQLAENPEQARIEARRAVEFHRRTGNHSSLANDLTFLHFLLFYQLEELEAAYDVLFRELPPTAAGDGESAYLAAFYRGQWAVNTGNARIALDQLGAAVRHAERLGRMRERNLTQQVLADQMRRLGHHAEATALFARLVEEIDELTTTCDMAKLLNNAAWDLVLALDARLPAEDPLPWIERAVALVDRCPAHDREARASLRLSLAFTHLHAGDPERARRELDRVRTRGSQLGRRLLVWRQDLEGRIAAAQGEPAAALKHFEALEELGTAADWPDVEWRAVLGRAQVLEATGQADAALAQLVRAEDLLDAVSLRSPIDAGRETSVASHEWGTRIHLDLLLRRDRPAQALAVARRARSRFFRGLARDARQSDLSAADQERWNAIVVRYNRLRSELEEAVAEDWGVPARHEEVLGAERQARHRELDRLLDEAIALLDAGGMPAGAEPPPVRSGELLLLYHPAPRGWIAFAADAETVDVHRFDDFDFAAASPAELAARLLEPFAEAIRRADRLRVLTYGALSGIDLHDLPFAGDVLAATTPVAYGLDLPAAPARLGRRALLIADPTGSLPGARKEVASVERALARPGGWEVSILGEGADGPTRSPREDVARLRDLLPRIDLLHFAGHADFAGHSLASGLGFDRDAAVRLTVGDILTSPGVPAVVVLSACETARASAGEAPVGLGLAHAFLLAGSRVALGAVRPVDDRTTTALVRHFYAAWDGAPESAAAALATAQIALRREAPAADWASFRILER